MPTPRLTARVVVLAGLVIVASACGRGTLDIGHDAGGGATGNGGAGGGGAGASGAGAQPDGGHVCPPVCERLCPGGNVIDANGCPTCECKPLPCDGTMPEDCTASFPPICECDPGRACAVTECGGPPPPAQPMPCPDGSVPPFDCLRNDDRRTCGWRVRQCPPLTLEQSLQQGYWLINHVAGDCYEIIDLLRFLGNGLGEKLVVNNDACSPTQRGTTSTPMSYNLNGRTLTMSHRTTAQRFDVAIGTLGSLRVLFYEVYVPVTATSWRGHAVNEQTDGNIVVGRTAVTADLRFAAALPIAGAGDCSVDVDFTVTQFTLLDASGGELPPDRRYATVTGSLPSIACRYGPNANGQQVQLLGVDFSAQPSWAKSRLVSMVATKFWLSPAEPNYLFKGTWYQHRDSLPPSF